MPIFAQVTLDTVCGAEIQALAGDITFYARDGQSQAVGFAINNRKTSEPKQRHAHAAEQER